MKRILHTLNVVKTLIKLQLSSTMMYRFNFWGALFADTLMFLIQLLFFVVITQRGNIGDWTTYHLYVFVGTFLAINGLYMATYFFGIIRLPRSIQNGNLDLVLVKPVNTLLYCAFCSPNLGSLGMLFIGLGIAMCGALKLGTVTLLGLLQYSIVFLLMYLLVFALMIFIRIPAFWMTRVTALSNIENTLIESSFKLPSPAIYGFWKVLLFFVLPYGLIANLPSQALFGPFGVEEWTLSIGSTAVFLALSLVLWRVGRKRYDSASS